MSNCLFCAYQCPAKFLIVDGQVRKLKTENDSSFLPNNKEEDDQNSFKFPGDSMITEQLKVIFILRTILKIGEEQLCEFLGSSGQLHPEYWISVCSSCQQTVQKCYATLKEIGALERRLLKLSNQLVVEIQRSKGAEATGPTGILWKTIRNEVLKEIDSTNCGLELEVEPIITATRSLAGGGDGVVLKKPDKDGGEESDLEWEPNHDLIDKDTYNNKEKQGKRYTEEDDDDDYVPRSKKTKGTRKNGVGRSVSKTEKRRKLLNKGVTRVSTTGNPKYTAFYRGHTKHYACIQCPATDTYPSLMEAHLKLHEEGSGAIPCPDCGWLVLPDRMNYHYGKRHPLPGGACRSGKKGKKREEKRYHFKCPECKALLTSVGKYREHEELHASGGGQVCKRCGWLCKRMSNHKAYWHVPHRKIPQREIKLMKKRGENDYLRRKHGGSRNLEGNEESHSNGAFNDSLAVMNAKWNAEMEEELNIKFSASAASWNPSSPVSEHHSSLFLDSDDDLIRQEEVNAEPQLQTQVESDFLKKSRSNSSKKIVIHSLDTSHPKYTRYFKGPTKYYGCRECPAEDSYLKLLEAHMKLHEEGSGAIPCPECGWLVMPDKLSFHKGKHHRPADLPTKPPNNLFYFKCPDCKALLCSVGRYRDHEQMHENGKGKNCAICGWLVKEVGRHSARWHPTDPKSAKGKIMYPRKIKLMKKRTENKLQSSA
ncbi:unnamed protein product [Orchesella dallaii]|uniref:C2H2-type domain-containing protein n=1 Tax=Orchesella dallaii TaxID=48710 RepID=A0ABP1PZZ5_9HEXA